VTRYCVTGGAGFIGGHLVQRLLTAPDASVKVIDNLSSGSEWRLADVRANDRLELVVGDLGDLDLLTTHLAAIDHAYHLAANPDIARAMEEPAIDFWQGTHLTNNLLEACRINGVPCITYMSGSGVYGDRGFEPVREDSGGLYPISTYGASKLACEVMMSAYCHMFAMHAVAFRFANVVGPRQTHGVTFDFVRRLLADPKRLRILGDGSQSKSYIHVSDVVDAMILVAEQGWQGFEVYNVSTDDYTTVREIADMVVEALGLHGVEYAFTGGERGWKGDVPVVRFDSAKIRARGWSNRHSSSEALADSIAANIAEARQAAATNAAERAISA
jgi:UDP-glucose 4-epimerase